MWCLVVSLNTEALKGPGLVNCSLTCRFKGPHRHCLTINVCLLYLKKCYSWSCDLLLHHVCKAPIVLNPTGTRCILQCQFKSTALPTVWPSLCKLKYFSWCSLHVQLARTCMQLLAAECLSAHHPCRYLWPAHQNMFAKHCSLNRQWFSKSNMQSLLQSKSKMARQV